MGDGHAGCFLKLYEDRRSTIELVGSLDINMKLMSGKHESAKERSILKSDMNVVSGKRN